MARWYHYKLKRHRVLAWPPPKKTYSLNMLVHVSYTFIYVLNSSNYVNKYFQTCKFAYFHFSVPFECINRSAAEWRKLVCSDLLHPRCHMHAIMKIDFCMNFEDHCQTCNAPTGEGGGIRHVSYHTWCEIIKIVSFKLKLIYNLTYIF